MCTRSKVYISSTIALISWLYLPVFPSVACGGPMDIVIVLDGSNSIYPWEPMNMFLEKLIPALDIGPQSTQVGLFSLTTFYFYIHFTGSAFLPIYTQWFVHPFRSVSFNMGWLPNLNSDWRSTEPKNVSLLQLPISLRCLETAPTPLKPSNTQG